MATDAQLNGPSWPDVGKLLQNLLSSVNTSAQNGSGGVNGTSSSQQPQSNLPPAHQAAVDGAIQGIKKAASDAASTGGLDAANHIINLATNGVGSTFGGQQPSALDTSTINTPQAPVQQPAVVTPAVQSSGNPLGDFMNMLGINATPQGQELASQAALNRQKLQAGNPAEIAVPQAQAQELQQKIAGAEPIQPKDIADLNRQSYSATIQAANDAWQRNTDEIKTMQEQYKALQEGRSGFSKGIGGQTKQMMAMQQAIIAKMKQNQQHLSNMQILFKNPPNAATENTQAAQQANSPFQVGQQYNGETIKNVRRIK